MPVLNVLFYSTVFQEIPAFIVPFLIYEISVNTFFSYVKILWCMVYGLAIHAPIEFILFRKYLVLQLLDLNTVLCLYNRLHLNNYLTYNFSCALIVCPFSLIDRLCVWIAYYQTLNFPQNLDYSRENWT